MMISYVLTVKNGSRFIMSCIDSVLNQSYFDLELIIIDDGSTDDTKKIIESISDNRVKFYLTDGIGRAKALNMGINKSSGEFIAIIDADDLIHSKKTHKQYLALVDNKFDVIFSDYSVFSLDDEVTLNSPVGHDVPCQEISADKLFIRNPFLHSSMMIRRSCLENVSLYDENLRRLLDYDLYFRLKNNGVRFHNLPEVLSFKRYHSQQQFERNNRFSYLISIFSLQSKYIFRSHKLYYLPFAFFKLFYSLLPPGIRKFINNKF